MQHVVVTSQETHCIAITNASRLMLLEKYLIFILESNGINKSFFFSDKICHMLQNLQWGK